MQKLVYYTTKTIRFLLSFVLKGFSNVLSKWKFYNNNVEFKSINSNGIPFIMVARGGKFTIGENFRINNNLRGNPIGRSQKCVFFVDSNAELIVGDNVGISSTAIVVHKKIIIGNNVKIGGNVCIYDTDFHSLNPKVRATAEDDKSGTKSKEVFIENNVFIGAHSTILKGVTIGENSIIGACSVVAKSIPANEIWAGNPAKFLKKVQSS